MSTVATLSAVIAHLNCENGHRVARGPVVVDGDDLPQVITYDGEIYLRCPRCFEVGEVPTYQRVRPYRAGDSFN